MTTQTNYFATIEGTRRPYKMYIKRNKKRIINPRVVEALKTKINKVELPKKFAWDKKNKKIVNLFSGNSNNTSKEFKEITKNNRKFLKYYGNTVYDRRTNTLVNKKKVYKKDGGLRKKYAQYKVLKTNQISETPTTITDKFFSFTGRMEVKYKNYTTKSGEYKQGATEMKTKQFTFKGKSNWTKKEIQDAKDDLYHAWVADAGVDSPYQSAKGSGSSGVSGVSGGGGGGGYSFGLNEKHFLTIDGMENQDWNTKQNRCVYDWIIHKFGGVKSCKSICNFETLFYIFNHDELEPMSLRAKDKEMIHDYFIDTKMTEKQFNDKLAKQSDEYQNFLQQDIHGGIFGAGEMLELMDDNKRHLVYKTYDEYLKRFWGVSPQKINNFCKYVKIPHYCLDNQDEVLHYYYPDDRNRHIPPMIYKTSGGHIHPITDLTKVRSLAQLLSEYTQSKATPEDEKKKKEEEKKKKKKPMEIIEVINCCDKIAYMIDRMIEEGKQVINNKVKMCGNDISSFVLNKQKYIFIDTSEDNPVNHAKKYCEYNNIEYWGQKLTTIAMEKMKEHILVKSEPNNVVNDILHTDKVKFRAQFGLMGDYEEYDITNDCKAFDISKCYSKCITDPTSRFFTFDYNALPQPYKNQEITEGLYYIDTKDTTLYHGSNLYSNSIVSYGLLNNIINKNNILWFIPASNIYTKSLFVDLFDTFKKACKGDTDLNKRLNNLTTGLLGISKQNKTKFSCSTSINDAFDYITEHINDKCYLRQHNNICVYGNKVSRKLEQHNIPIYIQILDDSNIRLYELMKEATNNNINNVIYRKTDCVVVKNPNPNIKLGENWGDYRLEELPTKFIHCDYENRTPQIKQPTYDYNYQYVDITDSSDYKQIHQVLRCNKGLMINGGAGTGKSYVIKQISKAVGDEQTARLCFTNKGAININGQTIHKFLGLNKEGKILQSNIENIKKNIKLVIIDEVSMVSSFLWARLDILYQQTKIPFLLVGDWQQIQPVEDLKPFDYLHHPTVVNLSGGKIVELQTVYRYDDKLKQASKDVMNLDTTKYGNLITKNNLCYMNSTRKFVNDLVVKEMIRSTNPKKVITIKHLPLNKSKNETEKQYKKRCDKNPTQTIQLFEGMPIIASKTIEKGTIAVNNEVFNLKQIKKSTLIMESTRPEGLHSIEIEKEEFYHGFLVGYCITTHKAQGSTIDGRLSIWDWEEMDEKLRYTAITRATKLENINFCKKLY